MTRFGIASLVAASLALGCAAPTTAARSTAPSDGPGPNRETQVVAFELVKLTLLCLQSRKPKPGKIVMAAEFSPAGSPVQVFDSASTPGNEEAIDCAIREGGKLSSPPSPPSRFVRYEIVFPGGPEDIVFDFPKSQPPRKPRTVDR